MKILVLDTENSGSQRDKAHPFNYENKMCYLGTFSPEEGTKLYDVEYSDTPYGRALEETKQDISRSDVVVVFNGKYDLHWLRRYGITVGVRVYDVQLAWFILTGQKHPYPSLDQVAEYYGIEKKLDIVATEYWDKGLDTPDVPREILEDYLAQDLNVTYQCYLAVQEDLKKQSFEMQRVVSIAMQDLLVLEEMEWNGMLLDKEKSLRKGDEIVGQIEEIDNELRGWFGAPWANINSGDHLSVLLYGGTVEVPYRETYLFTYKDGRTAEKVRWAKEVIQCPRQVEPLKGTALKKDGYFSTDVDTLKSLKGGRFIKKVVEKLLLRSKLEKRRSTYFHGLPKKIKQYSWHDDRIHATLNQCVAITGRLSSSKPNLQNVEELVKEVFVSRYAMS